MSSAMVLTHTAMSVHTSSPPLDQDADLVAAARNGDDRAFGELVRRHQNRVFRLAGRFFRRREDVEDAAQETFLIAGEKLHTYAARAPFEHWLTRICLNCCYSRLRKEKATFEPFERELIASQEPSDTRLDMERLLGRLPSADRFILLLLHGEEWSIEEIADRTGWSKSNVKVKAHRARKKLRQMLEES